MSHRDPNLWRDTPGKGFTDKFAVLMLDAETHRHGVNGRVWVTYSDAVTIAHHLSQAENVAREESHA